MDQKKDDLDELYRTLTGDRQIDIAANTGHHKVHLPPSERIGSINATPPPKRKKKAGRTSKCSEYIKTC